MSYGATMERSAPSPAQRRALRFENFDDVIADVRQLELGYRQLGNWNLAQTSDHLARFMRFSLDGFPPGFRMPSPLAWMLRKVVVTPARLQKPMRPGLPTPEFLKPSPPAAEQDRRQAEHAAVGRFVEQCRRVKLHGGEFFPSPLLGRLRPVQWRLLHLRHCENHLGLMVPDDPFSRVAGEGEAG